MNVTEKLDLLIKSVSDALAKKEELSKPPVSEAQRRAMHAAASGSSTLGIPKSVGKEFADADEGGKLPEKKKKKAEKAEKDEGGQIDKPTGSPIKPPKTNTLDYSTMKPPKAPEAAAPTISYSSGGVTRTPGASDSAFRTPKERLAPLKNPAFRSRLAEQRRAAGVKKTEISSEDLTKTLKAKLGEEQLGQLIKSAADAGLIHRNTLIEWINFKHVGKEFLKFASKDVVDELYKSSELDDSKEEAFSDDPKVHTTAAKRYRDMAEKAYHNRHWKGGGYASDLAYGHDELKDHFEGIKVMDDHKLAEHQKCLFEKKVALERHFMADNAKEDPNGDHNLTDQKTPNGYKA